MEKTWTALIGAFTCDYDTLYLYNAAPYRDRASWHASREELDASEFDDDRRGLDCLRRVLDGARVGKDARARGLSPVVYRVRVSYDERRPVKRQIIGRTRVWPLTALEQLARCAK